MNQKVYYSASGMRNPTPDQRLLSQPLNPNVKNLRGKPNRDRKIVHNMGKRK